RFVTDSSCTPTIVDVTISPGSSSDFSAMMSEVRGKGLSDPGRKYLVWVDNSNAYCGIGQYYGDESPDQNNYNNGAVAMFARVDKACWGLLGGPGTHSVEAHELTHTLGAVADDAPNSTRAGHCTDDYDTMCYKDSSGIAPHLACPDPGHEGLLDCNHDDYFS